VIRRPDSIRSGRNADRDTGDRRRHGAFYLWRHSTRGQEPSRSKIAADDSRDAEALEQVANRAATGQARDRALLLSAKQRKHRHCADLDVFPACFDVLKRLRDEGYRVEFLIRDDCDRVCGNSSFGRSNVAYRMNVQEYRRLCPYVREVERDWGSAPGAINSFGRDLLIQGIELEKFSLACSRPLALKATRCD
jgi:hypothetical protein